MAHVGGGVETPGPAPFRRTAPQLPHALYKLLRKGEARGGITQAVAQPPPPPLPPLPPAEATHAIPLPQPEQPESASTSGGPARQ